MEDGQGWMDEGGNDGDDYNNDDERDDVGNGDAGDTITRWSDGRPSPCNNIGAGLGGHPIKCQLESIELEAALYCEEEWGSFREDLRPAAFCSRSFHAVVG